MKVNVLNLEKEMYRKIKNFLSIKDLEVDLEFKDACQDDNIDLGSVFYDNGVEAKISLVSGMTAYWIEVQLFKNNRPYSEMEQFYNIDNLLGITIDCETYTVALLEKDCYYEIVTYCWVNLKNDMFNEEWEDNCMHGDLVYSVPTGWLIINILTDIDYSVFGLSSYEGKTIPEILFLWNNTYTHEEGYKLFNKATYDKVIKNKKVEHCDYCSS